MSRPDLESLRATVQPPEVLGRPNAEHWLALLVLRRVSLRLTALLVRTSVTANQLTYLMVVVGCGAAVLIALGGLWSAIAGATAVLCYFMLDLVDGEVARYRRQTSATGVYLDRLGHYVVEAALLTAVGWRAGAQQAGGWAMAGLAAGLFCVLVKAETDLVDVARVRHGLTPAPTAAVEPRNRRWGALRRVVRASKVHSITGAIELSALMLVAAVVDAVRGDLVATQVLLVALFAVALVMSVLHAATILASRRLL